MRLETQVLGVGQRLFDQLARTARVLPLHGPHLDAGQDRRIVHRVDDLVQGVFDAQTKDIHEDPGDGIPLVRQVPAQPDRADALVEERGRDQHVGDRRLSHSCPFTGQG
jgi:hypothetical protein